MKSHSDVTGWRLTTPARRNRSTPRNPSRESRCQRSQVVGALLAYLVLSRVLASESPPIGPSGIPLERGSYGVYELGALGGIGSLAYDIGEDGAITGEALDAAGEWHAFLWKDGVMTKLAPLPGGTYSSGRAISDAGVIGGVSEKAVLMPDGTVRKEISAVLWRIGAPLEFGSPTGSEFRNVYGMTAGGSLVGSVGTTVTNADGSTTAVTRPARWLGGRGDFLTSDLTAAGEAYGVNGAGTLVVGAYRPSAEPFAHAVIFGSDPPQDIHTVADHFNSVAVDANSAGVVVGYTYSAPSPTFHEPFFWTAARRMWRPPRPADDPNGQVMKVIDYGLAIGVLRNSGATLWLNIDSPEETWVNVTGLIAGAGPRINGPVSVNGYGEIAANYAAGVTHAVFVYPTNRWRQVSGSFRTTATESATNTAGVYPTFTYPIRAAPVELLAVRGTVLTPVARQVTGDQGQFAFLLRADTPDHQFALRFTLSDSTGWVAVFDASTDTNAPAWLRTPAFTLDRDVRADIELVINADPTELNANEVAYLWNGVSFAVGATNAPPADAASNSTGADFAPLTVIYRNIRLAAQFAKERLGLAMPRVPVYAFEIRGAYEGWKLEPTGTKDTFIWKNHYTNASSSTHYEPLSIHFSQMKSSFNQPTTGILGNPDGYSSLGSVTNVVTGRHYPRPTVFGRERPDNREFHEYGHAIMFHSRIGGVDHRPELTINPFTGTWDRNHGGYTNSVSTDSWIEGFAEFISAAISSRMLDETEKPDARLYVATGAVVNLDDNLDYTNDILRQPTMEEFLVASLLWDLCDPLDFGADSDRLMLPIEDLWSVLSENGPTLLTMKGVYDAFHQFGVDFPFRLDPGAWATRAVRADLYDDKNGNRAHDLDEEVGLTSWNPHFPRRWNAEPSTFLAFDVRSADGSGFSDVVFEFDVQYDPPLDDRHFIWAFPTYGPTPVALPFVPSAHPSRIMVTPHARGLPRVSPFQTTSTALWQALGGLPPGADGELASHTFIVPVAPRLDLARLPGGASLEFSWPVTDPAYELQFTFSLAPPVVWGKPPGTASRRSDRFVHVVPLPPRPTFLRLIQKP